MKKIFQVITFLALVSCTNKNEQDKELEAVKDFNKVGLKIKYDRVATPEKEVCAFFYIDNNKYHIRQGYADCDFKQIKSVNKQTNEIIGCSQKLYMNNDTIIVCLTPTKLGQFVFPNVKILFSDNENNYFFADTTLSIEVK